MNDSKYILTIQNIFKVLITVINKINKLHHIVIVFDTMFSSITTFVGINS